MDSTLLAKLGPYQQDAYSIAKKNGVGVVELMSAAVHGDACDGADELLAQHPGVRKVSWPRVELPQSKAKAVQEAWEVENSKRVAEKLQVRAAEDARSAKARELEAAQLEADEKRAREEMLKESTAQPRKKAK